MCARNVADSFLAQCLERAIGACCILIFCQAVASGSPPLEHEGSGYALAGLLAGTGIALPYLFVEDGALACGTCDPNDIPSFDRWASGSYGADANALSDSALAFSLGVPVASLSAQLPGQDTRREALVLAQSFSATFFATQIIKVATQRARPFTYSSTLKEGAPSRSSRDARMSFPSGHTSMAFAGLVTTAALRTSHGPMIEKATWYGCAMALGGLTGALRIAAGKHYWTDVAAGAVLGTGIGLLVPWLHQASGRSHQDLQSIQMPLVSFGGSL